MPQGVPRPVNSKDGTVVLSSVRALMDRERIAVVLLHHPSKADPDRARGWGGVDGEVDGTLTFVRPARDEHGGYIRVSPKDGEHSRIRFKWDPSTFAFDPDSLGTCTFADIAREVTLAFEDDGVGLSAEELAAIFVQHSPTHVKKMITKARGQQLIEIGGKAAPGPSGGAPRPIYIPYRGDEPGGEPPTGACGPEKQQGDEPGGEPRPGMTNHRPLNVGRVANQVANPSS